MFVLSIQNSACRIRSTCRSELSHNVNTYTFQQLLISVFGSSEHFLVVLCSMEVFCFHCCQPFTLICSQRPRHSLENVRVQRLKIRERAGMWGESVVADDKLTRVHDTLYSTVSHTQSLTDTQTHTHADTTFPPITAPRTSTTGVVGWRLLVSQLEAALVNRRHCVVYNDGQSPPSHWLHQNVSPCQSYKTAVRPFITSPSPHQECSALRLGSRRPCVGGRRRRRRRMVRVHQHR